jgi:protein gp37
MVFVNSMSDLFHVDVPGEFVRRIFEVMMEVDRHTYQVLTKRPARMGNWVRANADLFPGGSVPSHIWLGTSVENQAAAYRVDHLRNVPAEVRFLSCEPLIGALAVGLGGVHWVICGGESGIGARPMEPQWPVDLRDACANAGVPFFFKQWGGRTPKSGGRRLEGEIHNEMPGEQAPAALALVG